MQQKQREVLFLRPTPAFLSFLREQLPQAKLLELEALQTDLTAYSLPVYSSEDELLNIIETHFPYMFRYEVERWFGLGSALLMKTSFLDFLCCFKFELHSHIVLLEPTIFCGTQVLRVRPRALFVEQMQTIYVSDIADATVSVAHQVTLSCLTENSTVIIRNFENLQLIKPFIEQYFYHIFKMEMMRVCESRSGWPKVNSLTDFSQYFSIDVHTHLVHVE